jgi:hypothetical protein
MLQNEAWNTGRFARQTDNGGARGERGHGYVMPGTIFQTCSRAR